MEELTISRSAKRKQKPRGATAIRAAAEEALKREEAKKQKTLEEVYLEWHTEQFDAMKDALDSAFGENYDIIKHEFVTANFFSQNKATTLENKAIVNKLLDMLEGYGEIGNMRRRLAYTIIIHFKDLEVTNGGRTHPIKDLWVKLELSPAFCASAGRSGSSYFLGTRTTFNYAEITSDYSFSHLSGGWTPSNGFRDFCLGHTPFAFMCTDLNNSWDKNKFLAFCFQLEDYLCWESADGGPYRSINDIRERDTYGRRGQPTLNNAIVNRYYENILTGSAKIPVNFIKTPLYWGLAVKPGEELELLVTNAVDNKAHLMLYDPVSKRKSPQAVSNKQENINQLRREYDRRTMLTYKGNPIRLVITDQTASANDDVPMRASDGLISELTRIINQKLLKETTNEYK